MVSKLVLAVVAAIASLMPTTAAPNPGGGSNGVDIVPAIALIVLPGPITLATADGSTWTPVTEADAAAIAEAADVSATIDVDGSSFLLVGSVGATQSVEAAMVALMATTAASAPAPAADVHPKQAHDEYRLEKTAGTPENPRKIYKTLVVERRPGEIGPEFQRRSQRELEDAIAAGWVSVPD